MSIINEIQRIINAKQQCITAIQNKGVQIAENTTIDQLPNAINNIQTGSEFIESGFINEDSAVITSSLIITTLKKIPKMFILFKEATADPISSNVGIINLSALSFTENSQQQLNASGLRFYQCVNNNTTSTAYTSGANFNNITTDKTVRFLSINNDMSIQINLSATWKLKGKYCWIALY